jgi:hypothetical protein
MRERISRSRKPQRLKKRARDAEQNTVGTGGKAAASNAIPLFLKKPQTAGKLKGADRRQVEVEEQSNQSKQQTGETSNEYQQEADEVASQVKHLSGSNASSTNKDKGGSPGKNAPRYLQQSDRQSTHQSDRVDRLSPVSKALSSQAKGDALSGHVRGGVESELDRELGDVRVHDDSEAAEAASSINARAFTSQNSIYLGAGESQDDTHLMAHEATHTSQQNQSQQPMINRATKQRETRPTEFTKSDIEKEVDKSYWEAKVGAIYQLTYYNPVTSRLGANSEERDAVLSTVWQNKPAKVKSKSTQIVNIAARSGAKASRNLIYKFDYIPAKGKKKASVEIQFVGEDSAARVTAAPVPSNKFTPSTLALSHGGFPKNDIDAYFQANPDVHHHLYNWIENVAPTKFKQVISTTYKATKGKKTSVHNASFKVEGSKTSDGDINNLDINYLGAVLPQSSAANAGYHDKTYVDHELEKLQSKSKNKLGTIIGMSTLPKDEVSSVNYVIWQYFEFGTVKKSELDVIVPIAHTSRSVYYSLRFDAKSNDVEVERIGEAGKGKVKPDELSISRVQGFTDNSKDAATFSAWLIKRYPSVPVSGKTVSELQISIDKALVANSNKPQWFEKNYGIHILDATAGDTRMDKTHGWHLDKRVDIKDFQSSDLTRLEMTLQTMSLPVLAHLKSTQMVRQDALLVKKKGKKTYDPVPKTYGLTVTKGKNTTIIIFDSITHSETALFSGGAQGVRSTAVEGFAHELGHVVGHQAGIESKFNAFVKDNKIKAVSWYGASGKSEPFPEAFAFYHTDREWVKNNQPKLFSWFETLRLTGKPP